MSGSFLQQSDVIDLTQRLVVSVFYYILFDNIIKQTVLLLVV